MAESSIGGVDFSQYQTWQKVVAPTGATYYKVPGTGYLYDPFLSAAKGRPVLWSDPTPQLDEKRKAEAEIERQRKFQEEQASPLNQMMPVLGSTAGLIGGKLAIDAMTGPTVAGVIPQTGQVVMSDGTILEAGAQAAQDSGGFFSNFFGSGGGSGTGGGFGGGEPLATPEIIGAERVLDAPVMPIEQGFTAGNIMSGIAALKGGYDTWKAIENGGDGIRGATTTLGAGVGNLVLGPIGAAGGAAIGNLVGYGLQDDGIKNDLALVAASPLIGGPLALLRRFGGLKLWSDEWKQEGNRLNKLREQGVEVPDWLMGPTQLTRGRSKDELVALEEEKAKQGMWSNVGFAGSRSESDLKPEDIWGYSAFFEKYGNDWLVKSEQERRDIAQKALDKGAVIEHHGTIDVDWAKVDDEPAVDGATVIDKPPPDTKAAFMQGAAQPLPQVINSVNDIEKLKGAFRR